MRFYPKFSDGHARFVQKIKAYLDKVNKEYQTRRNIMFYIIKWDEANLEALEVTGTKPEEYLEFYIKENYEKYLPGAPVCVYRIDQYTLIFTKIVTTTKVHFSEEPKVEEPKVHFSEEPKISV